jgi:hypothetical protein
MIAFRHLYWVSQSTGWFRFAPPRAATFIKANQKGSTPY